MKNRNFLRFVGLFILILCFAGNAHAQKKKREFYQLKIYTFDSEEQQGITENYLENAFLPAMKRLGIKNIGVFKNRPAEADTVKKIYIIIPFSDLQKFNSTENQLLKDKKYLQAGEKYLSASYETPPFRRTENILLSAFRDMPVMEASTLSGPRKDRVYELRSYESATENLFRNKVEMFNQGGEVKLFKKLDFHAVFYGEVISGPKMPNLMYMTTFENQESRDAHWKTFVDAPEWKELSGRPNYQNNVSHIDILFLYPTEYSDY